MSEGLIVREQEPLNLEMPFSSLSGFITPNESFYVRCHFPIPEISAEEWRLNVEGEVEAPFELSYDELLGMESRTIAATLECAGNNRIFLEPKVKGVQWGLARSATRRGPAFRSPPCSSAPASNPMRSK